MGRYSIILKKSPEEVSKRLHSVSQFGFDQDINSWGKKRAFYLNQGEVASVGIVFDDSSSLFYGSRVHFFKGHKFFCKSVNNHLASCCQVGKATFRIATIVIKNHRKTEPDTITVLPWVFGKIIYERLRETSNLFPIDRYDIILKRPTNTTPFAQYEIQAGLISVWQESEMKPRILELHSHLKSGIRSYLAEDYTEDQIQEVISQPDPHRSPIDIRPTSLRGTPSQGPGGLRPYDEVNLRDLLENIEPQRNQQRDPRLLDPDRAPNPDNFWERNGFSAPETLPFPGP